MRCESAYSRQLSMTGQDGADLAGTVDPHPVRGEERRGRVVSTIALGHPAGQHLIHHRLLAGTQQSRRSPASSSQCAWEISGTRRSSPPFCSRMDDQYNHGATPMANFFDDSGTSREPDFPPPAPPAHATRRARPGLRGAVAGGLVGALVAGGVGFAAGRLAADDQPTARPAGGPGRSRGADGRRPRPPEPAGEGLTLRGVHPARTGRRPTRSCSSGPAPASSSPTTGSS